MQEQQHQNQNQDQIHHLNLDRKKEISNLKIVKDHLIIMRENIEPDKV